MTFSMRPQVYHDPLGKSLSAAQSRQSLLQILYCGRPLTASRFDSVALLLQPPGLRRDAARESLNQAAVVAHDSPVGRNPLLPVSQILFSRFSHDADEYAGGQRTSHIR